MCNDYISVSDLETSATVKIPMMNERLYLCSPSINVCFRAVIEGVFDKNKISQALRKVCSKHPLLNCSVEMDSNNDAWFVQNSSVEVEFYEQGEMDFQTWYKEKDSVPFDFSKGHLAKFCVIIGKNTEIIVLGHHIIGDGVGYLNLVKDVFLALDNRLDTTQQIPPFEPNDKYFKETVLLDEQTKSFAAWLNGEWRKSRVRFSEQEYREFFEQYRKKYSPEFFVASLDGAKKISEKSKQSGLTVNELVASAFSVALMGTPGSKELRLGVAASIRNELVSEPLFCMGNYVTGIAAQVNYNEKYFDLNTQNIARILREQLKNIKNRHLVVHFLNEFDKDLIEATMFAAYGDFDNSAAKQLAVLIGEKQENKGIGFSNLGRQDFHYESVKVLDLQFINPAFPANLLTVGIITVNDKFNFCLHYNEAEIKTDIVKSVYKRAVEFLVPESPFI